MGTLDVQEPSLKNLTEDNFGKPKTHQHETLQNLLKPHVESFNYMLRDGLRLAVQSIIPIEFQLPNGQIVSLQVDDANIHAPCIKSTANAKTAAVYPAECRQRGTTYKGRISMHLRVTVDKQRVSLDERQLGEVPIMVKSSRCNLHKLKPAALVRRGEEDEEMGGYFVINGNEKVVRMIIMPRRNYPVAIARPTWKNRGSYYTEYGVQIRCVTKDQTSTNNVIHYLSNGTAIMAFVYNKETFFVPVVMILKCLVGLPDQHIFQKLIQGYENNSFYKNCIANMLRMAQAEGLAKREDVLKYIGERFRIKLHTPAWYTDEQVTLFLLRYMTRKLFSFAAGESAAESADNPMFQEILLPGHLYQMVIKLKTESVNDACKRAGNITRPMEYFLATGNVISKSGLGLMQAAGFAVVADKLNFYRYLSHFRAVHRGAFFTEMRTTSVRKLLPEAWGFMCPVHTPDGAPCGLLNHMSAFCHVVNKETSSTHLPNLLRELGMETVDLAAPSAADHCYEVLLNGKVLGWIDDELVQSVADQLRKMKVLELNQVSKFTEICLVHKTDVASQYPGLYIFTNVARMMRPVVSLVHQTREYLGTFEQVYLNISVVAEETITAVTTHQEISEIAMLSAIASLTPFSDFNQSPRNMYQCQMGKQTMGTPLHAYMYRADNKLYRIQTPQVPLVRPAMHDYYNIDNYPLGTNAVVAVISYTGYDMEDAMILNKGSFERGFGHGSVYKSDVIDLHRVDGSHGRTPLVFASKPGDHKRRDLDDDGLPPVGRLLVEGDPYYSYLNVQTGEYTVKTYRSAEPAYLEQVKMLGDDSGSEPSQKVCLFLRVERNPIIGDKFSSRHGQKGICSQKWPVPNMPFTESGMTPDILFNPHGFPSRMTIGMMIESMAGKSAAMHGLCHDATPFTFSEDNPAIDYFGRCLREAGYNYYGTERMYSGISGLELEADIFVGIVYYQRLRHMVSDKFQVRTTGPVDQLTHQPVKGRKRHGGIRFGEMERDAMLSHGTSFLLQDRLFNCSDRDLGHVCRTCGSLMSTSLSAPSPLHTAAVEDSRVWKCSVCGPQGQVEVIELPYVFRYLAAELAAMNIKIKLDIKSTCM